MKFEVATVKENSGYALETLKDSWVLTAKHFFPLFIGWFLSQGVPVFLIGILALSGFAIDTFILHLSKPGIMTITGLLLGAAALGSFWTGWARIALKIVRNVPTKSSDVISSPAQIMAGLVACAITSVLIGMGWWLIIPGFLLMVKWQLTPFFIVDQNCGPIAAMKKSWHATDEKIFIPLACLDLIFIGLTSASTFLVIGPVICFMALTVSSAIVYSRWLTDENAPFNKAEMLEDHDMVSKP